MFCILDVYYSCVGSYRGGLELLGNQQCHATFAHIYHRDNDEFNFQAVDHYPAAKSYVIFNLFRRDIVFVSQRPVCSLPDKP